MSEKLHKTYERLLKHHPHGSALYTPAQAKDIYPGCIGAFNNDGHWIPAKFDVTTTGLEFAPLKQHDLHIESLTMKLDGIHSQKVSDLKVKVNFIASLFPTIVPTSVEAKFQIDSTSEGAAVLHCGPVIRTGISNLESGLYEWVENNKGAIFKRVGDAKKYGGFLLVTAVYKTNWCRTRCWSNTSLNSKSQAKLSIGQDDAAVKTGFRYSTQTMDEGGLTVPAEKNRKKEEFVIFVEGIFCPRHGDPSDDIIYGRDDNGCCIM